MKNFRVLNFMIGLLAIGMTMNAQSKISFLEKWEEGQKKADGRVCKYLEKNPNISHFKPSYKCFYDSISKKNILLDMFIEVPEGSGPFPVIIFMHGGGFVSGNKAQFIPQIFALASKGIVGISIEYRLRGHGGDYSDFIKDVMDAIGYVRENADKYKIDFSKLGLGGGSAGAYLSAIAAMETPECICYIGYNGPYDITRLGWKKSVSVISDKMKKELSPIYRIKTPPPAILLFHGKADTTVPPEQSISFVEAIREKGGKAEVLLYDGQKHGFFNKEPYLGETTETMMNFACKVFNLQTW